MKRESEDKYNICPVEGDFYRFVRRWDEQLERERAYQKKAEVAINQVMDMHTSIGTIHQDTKHLKDISETNKRIAESFGTFCGKFEELEAGSLAAALGKKHVPMPIFFFVVITLCVVIIGQAIGQRYFEATPSGFKFNSPFEKEKFNPGQ